MLAGQVICCFTAHLVVCFCPQSWAVKPQISLISLSHLSTESTDERICISLLCILEFLTVGQIKQAIWRCHLELWEAEKYVSLFSDMLDWLIRRASLKASIITRGSCFLNSFLGLERWKNTFLWIIFYIKQSSMLVRLYDHDKQLQWLETGGDSCPWHKKPQ